MHVQEAMHLGEEERRIYISLTNQERLAAQEDAHAAKVRPCIRKFCRQHAVSACIHCCEQTGKAGPCRDCLSS